MDIAFFTQYSNMMILERPHHPNASLSFPNNQRGAPFMPV